MSARYIPRLCERWSTTERAQPPGWLLSDRIPCTAAPSLPTNERAPPVDSTHARTGTHLGQCARARSGCRGDALVAPTHRAIDGPAPCVRCAAWCCVVLSDVYARFWPEGRGEAGSRQASDCFPSSLINARPQEPVFCPAMRRPCAPRTQWGVESNPVAAGSATPFG